MTVYVAYSDEAGTPKPTGPFVVGGYIACEKQWPQFAEAWAMHVLESPPRIPYLHMVELRSKEFQARHDLTWEDVQRKVAVGVKIIRNTEFLRRYFGTTHRGKLTEIYENLKRAGCKFQSHSEEPDYICFLAFAWALLWDVIQNRNDVTRVNFAVSKKRYVSHYYAEFKDELRSYLSQSRFPELAPLVGDLIPLTPSDHMPLQAADCLLWHLQRAYAHNLETEDEKNLDILESTPGLGREWSADELEAFARGLSNHGENQGI